MPTVGRGMRRKRRKRFKIKRGGGRAMTFRVVRILLDTGEYETLATSLPRSITASEIKELYHARWGIETAFRELKYGLGLVNLHGKKDEFVKQEIFAAMIMSNFCSRIVNEIVMKQKKNNLYEYKVNMKMEIYICKKILSHERCRRKRTDEEYCKIYRTNQTRKK
ncbi:MAG: transposase [Roseburia sp.]